MTYVILKQDLDQTFDSECMEFHLTYNGPLASTGSAKQKQEVRRIFHPQLKKLWEISSNLKALRDPMVEQVVTVNRPPDKSRLEALPDRFKCGPYKLVLLVTRDLKIACGLDILFLRRDYPGAVIKSGDIDNRLKTLFDGLRIPGPDANELGGCTPQEGESPFHCLLEDDSLITHIAVKTDTLLQGTSDANEARLVINVKIKPIEATIANLGFN
jgi:hypothetical protein